MSKGDNAEAATFLHLIGSAAYEVSQAFTFHEGVRKKLKELKENSKLLLAKEKHTTMERYTLLMPHQHADKLFDEFITDLRMKARFCDLPSSANSRIRHCVVWGINSIHSLATTITLQGRRGP